MDQQSTYAEPMAAPREAGPDVRLEKELQERAQLCDKEATQLEISAREFRRTQAACIAALESLGNQDKPF